MLRSRSGRRRATAVLAALPLAYLAGAASTAAADPKPPTPTATAASTGPSTSGSWSLGQPQAQSPASAGCGSNVAGEPAVRVAPDNNVIVASERGLGQGTDAWHGVQTGGLGASGCALQYSGQPNAVVNGLGASGGDVDVAVGSAQLADLQYRIYLASLNLGSVSVSHSDNGGQTYTTVPVVAGLPGDDRPWIAAFGADTSLLSFHDLATRNIDVLRSDDGGLTYHQISQAITPTSTAAQNGALFGNQHGNIAIDRINTGGAVAPPVGGQGFWAYQSFVSFSSNPNATQFNEAYLAVSNDGGYSWTDQEVPCSIAAGNLGLDNQFPNVSVDPSGRIWMTWSAGTTDSSGNVSSGTVFAAVSPDHGQTWTCSSAIASGPAVMPWIAATSAGEDLVFYQASGGPSGTWSAAFAQNTTGTANGWGPAQPIDSVHSGPVCEAGFTCQTSRQLFDDFGVSTDSSGFAHVAYSHDSPNLGGPGTYTGYAVQTGGTAVGRQN